MKAASMDARPSFKLMKQSDIVSFFHLQMPRWLFSHRDYKSLSLEAKVAYTFLLNRFQLSRLNGWVNKDGEVFVIFTRESLAEEMQITYKKAIACFKELVAVNLIWEKRVGRGNANQIYLALVELSQENATSHRVAPFGNEGVRPAESADQELPAKDFKTCQNSSSRPAKTAHPEVQKQLPSKKEKRKIDMNENEIVSPSVTATASVRTDRQDIDATEDAEKLDQLLSGCELWILPEEVRGVFESAIERLFYSNSFRIGNATLPQEKVRSHLWRIDGMVLQDAYYKLRANTSKRVKNSTAYVMATLFNAIYEGQSDLLVDAYLNSLQATASAEQRKGVT